MFPLHHLKKHFCSIYYDLYNELIKMLDILYFIKIDIYDRIIIYSGGILEMKVQFYESVNDDLLKFAVIIAKYHDKWVFCKHKQRQTFEIPGGHRESHESILDCAKRELYEETGALDFSIEPICVYSVIGKNRVNQTSEESFGMLYYACIQKLDNELHSEMEKIVLLDNLPENWTYPLIQPLLIQEFQRRELL